MSLTFRSPAGDAPEHVAGIALPLEHPLAHANGQSRTLIDALPAAVYMTDAAGSITYYNEAAAELWGCRPALGESELCGSWKLYWPDGTPLPHDECPMALALKQRRPIRGMEAIAERPDGTRIPFIPYPTPLFDASGTLTGGINMLVDISDRKRAEEALSAGRARLVSELAATRLLQKVSTQLIQEDDVGALYQQILDAAVAIMGSDMASMQIVEAELNALRVLAAHGFEQDFYEAFALVGPDARTSCSVARRVGARVVVADVETCAFLVGTPALEDHRKTGIRAVQSTPLISRGGRMLGMISTHWRKPHRPSERELGLLDVLARQAADLIERKQAELADQRLAAIVDSSHDAIVSKDLHGVITTWNRGAEQLFGYAAEEAIGKPVTILIPADRHNEEPEILERIRRGQRIDHYETVRVRKDATPVDVSLSVSPVKDGAGKVIGASKIARDITERRQAQERQELLAGEVQHRTKNLFAVVQAVVSRSFAGKRSVEEARTAVLDRLRSLAQTHVMLIEQEWQGADIGEVVRTEMGPYMGRVTIEGPSIALPPKAAQNFALAVHELATNAAKYGALSNPAGRVHIGWSVLEPDGARLLRFRWQERGGPPVTPPTTRGFGSTVLEQVMAEYFDTPPQIAFARDGVRYELTGSLDTIAAGEGHRIA